MSKLKFSIIYLCIFLFTSVSFINCSEDNAVNTSAVLDTSDFRYPFTDGSSWSYEIIYNVSNIRPDSILHYFEDYPIVTTGTVTILYDTLYNTVMTKCFLDEFNRNGVNYSNRLYFINTDSSFTLYASHFSSGYVGIFPLKSVQNPVEHFMIDTSQKSFSELEIFSKMQHTFLKYPLETGIIWSIYAGDNDSITYKYMGFELVNLPSGSESCMKVNSEISYVSNENYNLFYSKSGLMKKQFSASNSIFRVPNSPFPIGTRDVYNETKITSYNILSK